MGVNDDCWEDLLSHIRDQRLVPVTGPDLTVVNVGHAEQTLATLIGQRLAERFHLTLSPGIPTMGGGWRRSCMSAATMRSSGCIASLTTSSWSSIRRPAMRSVTSPRLLTCAFS
jgi:hypothetical protein